MNILVDSSLTTDKDWFELLPLNFILDDEELLDFNSEENSKKISFSLKKSTSFFSPEAIKGLLSKNDQNIIFTIPKSLSGQFNIYKNSDFENTLVLEGQCFLLFEEEVKKILYSDMTINEMEQAIKILNDRTEYDGLVISPSNLPKKGRISYLILNILEAFCVKVWMQFSNGKWSIKSDFFNTNKVLKKIIKGKKEITIITFDKETFEGCKELIKLINNNIQISYKRMSNAMIAHVGNGFIALA